MAKGWDEGVRVEGRGFGKGLGQSARGGASEAAGALGQAAEGGPYGGGVAPAAGVRHGPVADDADEARLEQWEGGRADRALRVAARRGGAEQG